MMENKNILIIGATGTWGLALLERLLNTGAALIRVFARNEHNMVSLQQKFPDKRVQVMLGDVRDRERLDQACAGIDIAFHLAALKHVPMCEQMPLEAIATNVVGTQNVIDSAIRRGVGKVIYSSTDKAVLPQCTYGCSKLLGEKLMLCANDTAGETKFIVFRSGNLLGSSGSVVPLFEKQIRTLGQVHLTHERMSRFFIPVPQAVDMLIQAADSGAGGEVFLPRMHALMIRDIAKYLLLKNGLDQSKIVVTGIRPGEVLSECMTTEQERKHLYQVSDALFALIGEDDHSWAANGFVKAGSYQSHSADAALTYEKALAFLNACGI